MLLIILSLQVTVKSTGIPCFLRLLMLCVGLKMESPTSVSRLHDLEDNLASRRVLRCPEVRDTYDIVTITSGSTCKAHNDRAHLLDVVCGILLAH